MKHRNVEKKINTAISNNVPNVLDDIIKKCEKKRGFSKDMRKDVISKKEKNTNFFLTSRFIGALSVAILLIGIIGFTGVNQYKVNSIIEFDVNPSIEIKVNKKEKVLSAISLNKDADKILKDMDLKNVDLNVAVNAIIGSMMKNGYLTIDQNSILVSVKNNDSKESKRIQKELTTEINKLLKASKIEGAVLTQEFDNTDESIMKIAKEYNISEGKAKLINNVIIARIKNSKGELYTFEQLNNLSINELNILLNEKKVEIKNVSTTGKANQSAYIGKEKAKSIALTDAGVKESNIQGLEIDIDAELGKIIYEIEFNVGIKEYDYEIDAKTGTIIHKETGKDYDNYQETVTTPSINNQQQTTNNTIISKEQVKNIVLKDAGLNATNIYEYEVELDTEKGLQIYEVEFKSGNKEYSYEINAKTGKIIKKEVERD